MIDPKDRAEQLSSSPSKSLNRLILGLSVSSIAVVAASIAYLSRGFAAFEDGDTVTATTIFVTAVVGALALLIGGVMLAIFVTRRQHERGLQVSRLAEAYPNSSIAMISTSREPGMRGLIKIGRRRGLGQSDAIVISDASLRLVKADEQIRELALARRADVVASTGSRLIGGLEFEYLSLRSVGSEPWGPVEFLIDNPSKTALPLLASPQAVSDAIRTA